MVNLQIRLVYQQKQLFLCFIFLILLKLGFFRFLSDKKEQLLFKFVYLNFLLFRRLLLLTKQKL